LVIMTSDFGFEKPDRRKIPNRSVLSRFIRAVGRRSLPESESNAGEATAPQAASHPRAERIFRGMIAGSAETGGPLEVATEASERMRAYIDKLLETEDIDPRLNEGSMAIAQLLPRYIASKVVDPRGYVMAVECLLADCKGTGLSGYGESMPSQVRNLPDLTYATFRNVLALDLARGAFGDTFAAQALAFDHSVGN
jgi:hypothetical protein